jgi:hypothetical protein
MPTLVVSGQVALLTAFFFAWSVPIPRRLFARKIALGFASIITGSLAYSLVWLIPIDHLRSWELAVAAFALFNLCVFVWWYCVAWTFGAFPGAVLMLTYLLRSSLGLLGVPSRVTFATIFAPGLLLVFALTAWGWRIFKRGTTLGWRLIGWGPLSDDPNALDFYRRVVDSSRRRAVERGYARMQLAWLAFKRGDRFEAIHEMERATSLLGGDGASGRRAEAYRTMGQWLVVAGEVEEAHAAAHAAITIARSLVGGRLELTRALMVRGLANAYLGNLEGARRDADEAKRIVKRVKDVELESLIRDLGVLLTFEDLDEAEGPD